MRKSKRPATGRPGRERTAPMSDLVRRLAEAEAALEALFESHADAVLDPAGGAPLLLRQAHDALRRSRDGLEARLQARSTEVAATSQMPEVKVTEHRRTAEALSQSEERFRRLLELAPETIAVHGDGVWVYMNPAGLALLGAAHPGEILGRPVLDFVHPNDRAAVRQRIRQAAETNQPTPLKSMRMVRLDGQFVHVEATGTSILYEGKPAVLAIARDITERVEAEETIARLATFPESNPHPVFEVDLTGRVHYANPATTRLSPELREAGAQHPWLTGLPSLWDAMQREGRGSFMREVRVGDAWYGQWLYAVPGAQRLRSYVFEITDRKQAEETLRRAHDELEQRVRERTAELAKANAALQAEIAERARAQEAQRETSAQLEGIIGSAMDAIVTVGEDQRIVVFNATAEQMFRCPAAEALGQSLDRFIPERFRGAHREHVRAFGDTKMTKRRIERLCPVVGLRADGQEFPLEAAISQTEVAGRRFYTAVLRDITERKRAEEALVESEERVRLLLDSTAEAIFGLDLHGNCTFCNPACLRLLGYDDPRALLGRKVHALIHHARADGTSYPEAECRICQAFRSGGGTHADDELLWRADGSSFPAEYWSYPVRRGDGVVGAVVTFVDITERKRAEEELRRSGEQMRALADRVEAVREEERSRIAREIHDDLGQALTGVKIDISRLAARPPGDRTSLEEKARAMGRLIDGAIRSVRRISMDLRPSVLDDLGLGAAIEWQAQDFQARTGIVCEVALREGDLHLDREQSTGMFRVFQETLTNVARHAEATKVNATLTTEADRLILVVQDDGRGITEHEISDPRSLGLLGMRERALLLGGEMTFAGVPGQGTTVTMGIPLQRPGRTARARGSGSR